MRRKKTWVLQAKCVQNQQAKCAHNQQAKCVHNQQAKCVHNQQAKCVQNQEVKCVQNQQAKYAGPVLVNDMQTPSYPLWKVAKYFWNVNIVN